MKGKEGGVHDGITFLIKTEEAEDPSLSSLSVPDKAIERAIWEPEAGLWPDNESATDLGHSNLHKERIDLIQLPSKSRA